MHGTATSVSSRLAAEVVDFWHEAGAGQWFGKDPAFDWRLRERFFELHLCAARREHDEWVQTPEGALALLILLDQFPRNAFRNTGHMYATDALARHFARLALAANHMNGVAPALRLFFCLLLRLPVGIVGLPRHLKCLAVGFGVWLFYRKLNRNVLLQLLTEYIRHPSA